MVVAHGTAGRCTRNNDPIDNRTISRVLPTIWGTRGTHRYYCMYCMCSIIWSLSYHIHSRFGLICLAYSQVQAWSDWLGVFELPCLMLLLSSPSSTRSSAYSWVGCVYHNNIVRVRRTKCLPSDTNNNSSQRTEQVLPFFVTQNGKWVFKRFPFGIANAYFLFSRNIISFRTLRSEKWSRTNCEA